MSAEPGSFADPSAPREKPCSRCGRWLPLEAFPVNRSAHWGRASRCRGCAREATRDWRRRNRDRENAERRARYRRDHPLFERPCVVCGRLFGSDLMRLSAALVASIGRALQHVRAPSRSPFPRWQERGLASPLHFHHRALRPREGVHAGRIALLKPNSAGREDRRCVARRRACCF